MHACHLEEGAAEPEPPRGIVVATDQHDPRADVVQPVQGLRAQLDGVQRRHRPVVDVPGHQDRVHLLRAHGIHQVVEEDRLRRPEIGAMQ
jgi:hypothetical protein